MLPTHPSARRGARDTGFLVSDLLRRRIMTKVWTGLFRLRCIARGIDIGSELEVYGHVMLRCSGQSVRIGNRVQLVSSSWRASFSSLWGPVRLVTILPEARIEIGDNVSLNGTAITCRSQTIRIGRAVLIGPNTTIADSDFHRPWPADQRRNYSGRGSDAGVDIEENVWVGAQCLILKGVRIGKNAVIAAGSVVSSAVPANALVRGNPARVVYVVEDEPLIREEPRG